MFFLFWVWSACVEHALTGMGSFYMQEGRLCLMNLRWWKAWSLTEVTYPHTLSPMPRHKKWWVKMSIVHFQALKIYLSGVILVANHAWFTLFLSTYDSGTWESSDSWNPKLCTDPVLFWLSTVHDLLFFSQHMIQELENPVVFETLNFLPILWFLVANCVWFTLFLSTYDSGTREGGDSCSWEENFEHNQHPPSSGIGCMGESSSSILCSF